MTLHPARFPMKCIGIAGPLSSMRASGIGDSRCIYRI